MSATTAVVDAASSAESARVRTHVALIAVSAVLIRIGFYLAYKPIWAGDSPSYSLAYFFWAHRSFYLGERTPVYPLLLGLAQWVNRAPAGILPGFSVVYTVLVWQGILNTLAAVGFYFTLRKLRVRSTISLVASVVLVTLAGLCFYEMQILNMSLAFTIITFIAGLYVVLLRRINAGERFALLAFGTGITLGIAILIRPELFIFTVVLVLGTVALRFLSLGSGNSLSMRLLSSALLMILGVAPLLLAWMCLMYAGIGEFRITTLDGWNKSRTVYNLFDRVGPEDRALGAVLSRSYTAQLAHGDQVNMREHMFIAFDDLKAHYDEFPIDHSIALHPTALNLKVAGLAFEYLGLQRIPCAVRNELGCYENMRARIDLGDYIGEVSSKLIRRYPAAWAKNVFVNWLHESFNFSYVDSKQAVFGFQSITVDGSTYIRNHTLDKVIEWAVRIEAPFLTVAYVVTLIVALLGPVHLIRNAHQTQVADSAVVVLSLSAVASMALMCAIAGFNRIYHVPFLAIFVMGAFYACERGRHFLLISAKKAEDKRGSRVFSGVGDLS